MGEKFYFTIEVETGLTREESKQYVRDMIHRIDMNTKPEDMRITYPNLKYGARVIILDSVLVYKAGLEEL